MGKFTLEVKGLKEAMANISRWRIRTIGNVVNELDRAALSVESQAKKNLKSNGSVKSGRLWTSVARSENGRFSRRVGTNVEYGIYVEFGTMRPRAKPFLYPAAEAERQRFLANLKKILTTI